jgi:hypothetical protein
MMLVRAALLSTSFALFSLVSLVSLGCAPAPKNTPCSNDGDCRALNEGYEYCLQFRCVKCIAMSMCEPGELCVDGECTRR